MTATRYTSEPPTEAGWYWMQSDDGVETIALYDGTKFFHIYGLHMCGFMYDVDELVADTCVFAGPIPRPEE